MTALPVIEPGPSTIRGGNGGAVVVGRHVASFPRMTRVAWFVDQESGELLALLLPPDGVLRLVSESGEVHGVPPAALEKFKAEYFPGT